MADGKKEIGAGFIMEVDRCLYGEDAHYEIFEKLDTRPRKYRRKDGMYFAVWAPHARAINLMGDFNGWSIDAISVTVLADSNIYEVSVPGLGVGGLYKYVITAQTGKILFKADPFTFETEYRPGTAPITTDLSRSRWKDSAWMTKHHETDPVHVPMSIYEVHPGSWKKKDREEKDGFCIYVGAAHGLADYVKKMGYTRVGLMGVAEHPHDGSWGYRVTGCSAPTPRYGTSEGFMYFVDYTHKHGISVILDQVPTRFPRDAHGLADFDGQALYKYADPRTGKHPDWGTKIFDHDKHEVFNFLVTSTVSWMEKFHMDGLKVDTVASMLHLDYDRSNGDWIPNRYGDDRNPEATEFFEYLNTVLQRRNSGAMMIAEESTIWPSVIEHPEDDGLGFRFKWNMGRMHDFLEYTKPDPYFRKANHSKMTFSMTYVTGENFILVLSHDEVVHLKCSMINKMPGLYEDGFPNLKVGRILMMGHPGKKLLFMGQDFGQLHGWDERVSLDWYSIRKSTHVDLQRYAEDLLHTYERYPALYTIDYDQDGSQWTNASDVDRNTSSFIRRGVAGKQDLLLIYGFTPAGWPDYRVGVPKRGNYMLLLDETRGVYNSRKKGSVYKSAKGECDGQPYSFTYRLPAYGTAIFRF